VVCTPLRIVVADENKLYRATLSSFLNKEANLQVVAEAGDGLAAIQAVQKHNPDVVLLSISMEVMNGLDAVWVIKARFPDVRVILLSMMEVELSSETSRQAGAFCCLDKECNPNELIQAIRDVSSLEGTPELASKSCADRQGDSNAGATAQP
jgi:two-component system nitrate/nitrite response regulator NarL